MKTSTDIQAAITAKREEERKELINWAIAIIDEASEEMFKTLKTSVKINVDCSNCIRWDMAQRETEVYECLCKNGFIAYSCNLQYFIKINGF